MGNESVSLIIKPIVTEKTAGLREIGSYVFLVDDRASKEEIRTAIESGFGVKVRSVRVARIIGKPKRVRGSVGRRALRKKAYVSLHEGQDIDFINGVF